MSRVWKIKWSKMKNNNKKTSKTLNHECTGNWELSMDAWKIVENWHNVSIKIACAQWIVILFIRVIFLNVQHYFVNKKYKTSDARWKSERKKNKPKWLQRKWLFVWKLSSKNYCHHSKRLCWTWNMEHLTWNTLYWALCNGTNAHT